jgi:hypothetical protein
MKTRILKAVFPMLAFVFAITAAFAFKPASDSSVTNHPGARKSGATCIETSVQCTDVNTTVICRDLSNNALFKYVGPTQCPDQLWKIMP